jgi:NAD+ synthase
LRLEDLADRLSTWIREQAEQAGCRGVVFGLSGGVDSAVVAALCQSAFPDSCLAVIMPCHSNDADARDADLVARTFSVPTTTAVLDDVFDTLVSAASQTQADPATRRLAEANLKPRLRMSALYYFANRLSYLVVGTGNRSEIAIGYSTKFGDGGVDILPLGNLLKRDVKRLAVRLGVPNRIIEKAPSAGLWEGQTDEGEMGVTYDQLDEYLSTGQAPEAVRKRIDALMHASDHKRALPPIPTF